MKKAEPAPSKSLDEMIENFHALLKRSPGEGVAIDKADAVDILADLISYQKSSSENAALKCSHPNIETMLQSVNVTKHEDEFVCYTGWLERCANCLIPLGSGYGDADYYPTRYKANKERLRLKPYLGKWIDYLPTVGKDDEP